MRLFVHQLRGEQRLFWRSRELAFFTFLFPVILFALLGSVYGDDTIRKEGGIKASAYLLAGLIGYGAIATAFAGLSIVLVIRRESGVLKRVRGTPLPPSTYVAASLGSTTIVYLIEVVILIVLARLLYDVPVPDHPSQWVSLVLAVLLGVLSFAALGLALTGAIRSDEGASAVVNAIFFPVAFLAGAFWSARTFPGPVEAISDVLPLTYLIRLMRDILIFDESIWENWQSVAVVAGWGLLGLVLAVRFFRWTPREG